MTRMKVASIVGARPQFIKAIPVSRALKRKHKHILIHTGQHYDYELSDIFFESFKVKEPDYNLGVGSGSHAYQTGKMLIGLEDVIMKESPDVVLVYGDTNSTLAGALAVAKTDIPLAHIEAGLRSGNRRMPEEINRLLTDHISNFLFCPTRTAVRNLEKEGISDGVHLVGDVMLDLALMASEASKSREIQHDLGLVEKEYYLVTLHRPENVDGKRNLNVIVDALTELEGRVIFPVHPRTKKSLLQFGLIDRLSSKVDVIPPVGYLDFIALLQSARKVLTDSGGVQKEAYFFGTPCITFRNETEWPETVEDGWNILVGTNKKKILRASRDLEPRKTRREMFGKGDSSEKIARILEKYIE